MLQLTVEHKPHFYPKSKKTLALYTISGQRLARIFRR